MPLASLSTLAVIKPGPMMAKNASRRKRAIRQGTLRRGRFAIVPRTELSADLAIYSFYKEVRGGVGIVQALGNRTIAVSNCDPSHCGEQNKWRCENLNRRKTVWPLFTRMFL